MMDLDVNSVKSHTKFHEDLGMDSFDSFEFIMEVEDEFYITIDDKVAEAFCTMKDVVDYVIKVKS